MNHFFASFFLPKKKKKKEKTDLGISKRKSNSPFAHECFSMIRALLRNCDERNFRRAHRERFLARPRELHKIRTKQRHIKTFYDALETLYKCSPEFPVGFFPTPIRRTYLLRSYSHEMNYVYMYVADTYICIYGKTYPHLQDHFTI